MNDTATLAGLPAGCRSCSQSPVLLREQQARVEEMVQCRIGGGTKEKPGRAQPGPGWPNPELLLFSATYHAPVEALRLAEMVSSFFPQPRKAFPGLRELAANAVEHGNLAIGGTAKLALRCEDRWEDELARRLTSPEFRDRRAQIELWSGDGSLTVRLRDQGAGFAWRAHLEALADGEPLIGAGLAIARESFDHLVYLARGQTVLAGCML